MSTLNPYYVLYTYSFAITSSVHSTTRFIYASTEERIAQVFIKWLSNVYQMVGTRRKRHLPQILCRHCSHVTINDEEIIRHRTATECFICGEPFQTPSTVMAAAAEKSKVKVHDHDHILGNYRGPAHMSCNVNYKIPNHIPVFIHNGSRYDFHLLVHQLAEQLKTLDAIAQNKEQYISYLQKF
ncbi:hypothetical protein NQ315_017045 [Exocentrus adspersus]|uniref:Uncharacterized protein n=1 Tax=Exocentrus adspersus TaxID=1586481 RepID=A0AAV8V8V4_9CUCU|nr:hypothetical protein NQ315_017045 [Exocentrus adspersus]